VISTNIGFTCFCLKLAVTHDQWLCGWEFSTIALGLLCFCVIVSSGFVTSPSLLQDKCSWPLATFKSFLHEWLNSQV